MEGRFVYSSSGDLSLNQHNQFTDVDPEEIDGLDNQWHLHAETKSAASHRIATLLVPMKADEVNMSRISWMIRTMEFISISRMKMGTQERSRCLRHINLRGAGSI